MFEDFTFPILEVMSAGGLGNTGEIAAFNYFFSLMLGIGFLLFIPCAIMKLLNRS